MTNAIESAIPTNAAPASSAGLFGQVNSGSRTSGSFAALFGQLAPALAHETAVAVPTTVPTAGGSGAQKPAGKATTANPPSARELQQNILATPAVVSPSLAAPTILDSSVPESAEEVSSSSSSFTVAAGNVENISSNRSSAVSQTTAPGIPSALSATQLPSLAAARQTVEDVSPAWPRTIPLSGVQLNLVQQNTDQRNTAAEVSVVQGQATQFESAQVAVASPAIPQTAITQPAGNTLPSATSTIDSLTLLGTPAPADCDPELSSVQAPVSGKDPTPPQTSPDTAWIQSPTDGAETSAAVSSTPGTNIPGSNIDRQNIGRQNIETSVGLPAHPPSIPSTSQQQPALPQSSPEIQPTEKPSAPGQISPSAHASGNITLPRFAAEPRPTPPPPDAALAATQPADASASSSALPLPGGNLSGEKSSNLHSNLNQFSHAPSGSSPSEGAAQAVNATSAVQDNSQSDNDDNHTPDASPHKTTALAAASTVMTPTVALLATSASTMGPSPADPAMQSAIQTIIPAPPQATPAGTAPGTTGTPDSAEPSSADSVSHLSGSAELPVHPSTGPVQMAQMVNQAAQSQMRIGMNTAAFGNVEVRTIVHANEVGVQIGSEKGDLRSLLANELPGIATSLQQQNLRLNQVNFHQTGFAFSNQMSSGGDAQPGWSSSRPMAATTRSAETFSADSGEPAAASSTGGGAGLSILA